MLTQTEVQEPIVLPEHIDWMKHRDLLHKIPLEIVGYRRCIGLAMMVDLSEAAEWPRPTVGEHDGLFVPDRFVRWVSISDVPLGHFLLPTQFRRNVHWASVTPTTKRFGMPMILSSHRAAQAWDYQAVPTPRSDPQRSSKSLAFDPEDALQLFRVFNAIEWTMTATAFETNTLWKSKCSDVGEYADRLLPIGRASPRQWMPTAYLAFPARHHDTLFDTVTKPCVGSDREYWPVPLCDEFLAELAGGLEYKARCAGAISKIQRTTVHGVPLVEVTLDGGKDKQERIRFGEHAALRVRLHETVKMGEAIGREPVRLPHNWGSMSPQGKMRCFRHIVGPAADAIVRWWFDRQILQFDPAFIHVPSHLAAPAARGLTSDRKLLWDVSKVEQYFREDCEAYVFPGIALDKWHHFCGRLPGDIRYSLAPNDPRFVPPISRGTRRG